MAGRIISKSEQKAFFRRRAAHRREHRDRQGGSSGAASMCRLIDPATGAVSEFRPVKITVPAAQLSLTSAPPKVNLSNCKNAERQHSGCVRHHMGDRRILDGQDRRRAARPPTNPSTLRSRKAREIAKQNRRDPLSCHLVRLPRSISAQVTLGMKTAQPKDREQKIFDQAWDDAFSEALRKLIEDAIKKKK